MTVALLLGAAVVQGCTTTMVGRLASKTGAVLTSHSDDGGNLADARLYLQPAADHAAGAMRDIRYSRESYPYAGPGYNDQPVIGQIPEVAHTYASFRANYGVMNEKQVGISETSCSAVFGTKALSQGGEALLSIDELCRIAIERCASSRCAVSTMGDLAEKHGFYGAGSYTEAGEALFVSDAQEGWAFQILPDNTGRSAIWAAQRIDDDKVSVASNMFTIRGVNTSNPQKFLASKNLHSIAQNVLKLWDPSMGLLDFTRVYSDGEYAHKYYAGRRMWGVYRALAPSAGLPDEYSDLKFNPVYPFDIRPDVLVTREDLFAIHRSYYEGTKYDMTQGLAAGPWGNPDRWNAGTGNVSGFWERSLGIYRTALTHVCESRSWMPDAQGGLFWYAPHNAPGSVFVPFCAGCNKVADSYSFGDPNKIDRSAYWAHKYVFNLAHIRYGPMMQKVHKLQKMLEDRSARLVESMDSLKNVSVDKLTATFNANAEAVISRWWQLPDELIYEFADGFINDGATQPYTDRWLQLIGFNTSGIPPVPCPPCPCAPLTSPQCGQCCGPSPAPAIVVDRQCELRDCIKQCYDSTDLRRCVRECDQKCV